MKLLPLQFLLSGSFTRQIVLVFTIGFFILVSGFSVYMVRSEKAFLYRDGNENVNSLADTLAASSLPWVLANDVAGLREIMVAFKDHPYLRYALIVSPSGRVIAHTDASKIGLFVSDTASLDLLKAAPQKRMLVNDDSVVDVAAPIMLQGRCIGWVRVAQGREGANTNLRNMMAISAVFVLLATALSLIAAFMIVKRLGRRIGGLAEVARQVRAGNFNIRAGEDGRDEIAGLGTSFNRMLDALERSMAERKAAEQEVARLALRNKLILDSAGDGIYGLDSEGRCTFINPAGARLFGFSMEELIGRPSHAMIHHTKADGQPYPQEECPVQAVFSQGKMHYGEDVYWRKDGSSFPVEYISTPIIEGGVTTGAVVMFRDITERKRNEQSIFEAQQVFRTLVENSPDIITRYDRDCKRSYVNPAYLKAAELDKAMLMGVTPVQRSPLPPASAEALQQLLRRVLDSGTVDSIDVVWPKADHINHWYNIYAFPEYDRVGRVVSVMTVSRDITPRKQAEEGLREKERHARSLLRLSRDLELSQTYGQAIAAAQDEVREVIGYNSVWVYLLSDDRKYLKALAAGGAESDYVMSEEGTATLTIAGDPMLEEIAAARDIVVVEDARTDSRTNKEIVATMKLRTIVNVPVIFMDKRLGSIGTGTFGDEGVRVPSAAEQEYLRTLASQMAVTFDRIHLQAQRNKAEQELRKLNTDFVILLENTGDFIYFKDKDGRIIFCSQTLAGITGHASWRDMVGKHDMEIFPPDTARIYYEEELPIFREGKPLLNKTDPYYDQGGGKRWVSTNKWPVFAEDGKTVIGIFGISRDITELKEAQDKIGELNRDLERRVEERTAQLEAANKELEAFSYSVSHDLRAPLRAIDGFSRIVLDEYADKLDDEGKRLLNIVRNNSNRMAQLIDDILQFSRTGRLEIAFTQVDMSGLAHEVAQELQEAAPNPALEIRIGELPQVNGDRTMLRQVFVNLLANAIKFSRARELPVVEVKAERSGEEIVYSVRDNGAGFDMRYQEKLFGVFQRLHTVEEFEGTGIGLAIVKRIVTRHGGRVWAEGKVGEGAVVYFALPAAEQTP